MVRIKCQVCGYEYHCDPLVDPLCRCPRCFAINPIGAQTEAHNMLFVEQIVKEFVDIGARDNQGRTPLHYAVEAGKLEIIKYLIERGADVNAADSHGRTPLHYAVKSDRPDVVSLLLEKGSEVLVKDEHGNTPLHLAAEEGYTDVIRTLLSNVKDPSLLNAKNDTGQTPLHLAVLKGHIGSVAALLRAGSDPLVRDNVGKTPIDYAEEKGGDQVTTWLLYAFAKDGSIINAEVIKRMCSNPKVELPRHVSSSLGLSELVRLVGGRESTFATSILHLAVLAGNGGLAKRLVEDCANVNERDEFGLTPLHIAAYMGDLDLVKVLVEHGADVNSRGRGGITPLHLATFNGNVEIVRYLLKAGAKTRTCFRLDPGRTIATIMSGLLTLEEVLTRHGMTPVHLAVYLGRSDVLRALVDAGADVNLVCDGNVTPLHLAVARCNMEMAKYLLDNGADPNVISNSSIGLGGSPLHLAVEYCEPDMVRLLVERGAIVDLRDYNGLTPLRIALDSCKPDVIDLLIKSGAEAWGTYEPWDMYKGPSPLHVAASRGCPEVVKYLVKTLGASPEEVDREGNNLLHAAVAGCSSSNEEKALEVVRYLVEAKKLDVNARNDRGETPLHLATKNNCVTVAKYLIEAGADVNVRDRDGKTPLHVAVKHAGKGLVELLLKHGADPNAADNSGMAPIHYAVLRLISPVPARTTVEGEDKSDLSELIELLVKAGADINARDGLGNTILHYVAAEGVLGNLEYVLVNMGADVNAVNSRGETPACLAEKLGHHENEMKLKQLGGRGCIRPPPEYPEALVPEGLRKQKTTDVDDRIW